MVRHIKSSRYFLYGMMPLLLTLACASESGDSAVDPGEPFGLNVNADSVNNVPINSLGDRPRARITTSAMGGFAPFTVSLSGEESSGGQGELFFEWDFDDGSADDLMSLTHTFLEPGLYNVQLLVTDSNESTSSSTLPIPVLPAFSIEVFEADGEFTFSAISDIAIGSYLDEYEMLWDFGDGLTGSGEIVDYTYANAGTFTVALTIRVGVLTLQAATVAIDTDGSAGSVVVADAGLDTTVQSGQMVELDARGSTGPSQLSYQWIQLSGPSVTLFDSTSATATFLAPEVAVDTQLQFQLTAFETEASESGKRFSDIDVISITIKGRGSQLQRNYFPTADAGSDISVTDVDLDGSETITLRGGASTDPDNDVLTYTWTLPTHTLAPTTDPNATVTLNVGAYIIQLAVSDTSGATRTDQLTVIVYPGAGLLSVLDNRTATFSGNEGSTFSPSGYDYTLENSGDSDLNWSFTGLPSWLTANTTSGTLSPDQQVTLSLGLDAQASLLSANLYQATLTLTDDAGSPASNIVVYLGVNPAAAQLDVPATLPQFTGQQGGSFSPANDTITLQNSGGNSYNWSMSGLPSWLDASATSGSMSAGGQSNITFTPNANANALAAGTHAADIDFTEDFSNETVTRTVSMVVSPPPAKMAVSGSAATFNGIVGGPFSPSSSDFTVRNDGGENLSWSLIDMPAWLTANTTSGTLTPGASVTVSVSPNANSYSAGSYNATPKFRDTTSDPDISVSASLTVNTPGQLDVTNHSPSFSGTVGGPFASFNETVTLSNTGQQSLNWTLTGLPTWLNATQSSGTLGGGADVDITFSPNANANSLPVAITTATLSFNDTTAGTTQSLTTGIQVTALPGQLDVSSPSLDFSGIEGGSFSPSNISVTLTNSGGSSLNWSLSGLPSWLGASTASGSLPAGDNVIISLSTNASADSLSPSTYNDSITFEDTTNSAQTPVATSLTVNAAPGELTVTGSDAAFSGIQATAFAPSSISYTLRNTGGTSLNWSLNAPNWLTADVSSGTLAPDAQRTVTISTNAVALGLSAGLYASTLTFADDTNNVDTNKAAELDVKTPGAQPMTAASRTTGEAPLAVFFDVVDVNGWDSGVTQPGNADYASWHYAWSFGDPSSGNFTSGRQNPDGSYPSRNSATGYIAAHVFENPGTYTVELVTTDSDGNQITYNQTITVSAFSGTTYYVSSSSGNDLNDGLSPATALRTFSAATTRFAANRRFLFKRGDTWNINDDAATLRYANLQIGAYYNSDGTDDQAQPKPKIVQAGTASVFYFHTDGDDNVVQDISIEGPGDASRGAGIVGRATSGLQSRSLGLRVDVDKMHNGVVFPGSYPAYGHDQNFYFDCNFTNIGSSQALGGNGIFMGGGRSAVVGCTVSKMYSEHCIRLFSEGKFLVANCTSVDPTHVKHALKFHAVSYDTENTPGGPSFNTVARYNYARDNHFESGQWIVTYGDQGDQDERLGDAVFERNVYKSSGTSQLGMLIGAENVTLRNNVFYATGSSTGLTAVHVARRNQEDMKPTGIRLFNNTLYHGTGGSNVMLLRANAFNSDSNYDPDDITISNNLVQWTAPSGNDVQGLAYLDKLSLSIITESDNNLVTTPGKFIWQQKPASEGGGFNLWDLAAWQSNSTFGDDSIEDVDPLFVDPANYDFSLQAGSQALDNGLTTPYVRDDFTGTLRSDGQNDIGAYER